MSFLLTKSLNSSLNPFSTWAFNVLAFDSFRSSLSLYFDLTEDWLLDGLLDLLGDGLARDLD